MNWRRLEALFFAGISSRRFFLAFCAFWFFFCTYAAVASWPGWLSVSEIACAGVQLFLGGRRYLSREPAPWPRRLELGGFIGEIRSCDECGAAVLCNIRQRGRIDCRDHTP